MNNDVSDRKRTYETSQYLASIVESSEDAIIGENLNGIVTSWNSGAELLFGYSADEMVGKTISRLFPPELAQEELSILGRIGRGERIRHYETAPVTRSGRRVFVSIAASPVYDANGKVVGASRIARDITERKALEEALTRTNSHLQQFAYAAAHDLQEPLRNVALAIQMARVKLPKQLDDETEALLDTAVQSAHQMESMVRDLLAYCKILHEEDEQCEVVESSEVLELALQNLATAIAEASGKITHDELPMVRMAKPHLLQVFQNLIGNALKHRAAEPPEIHIGVQARDKYCEFSVVDNGPGIEPQFQERVFDVFKRLQKKDIPGTGVGLALCKRIIERYGGAIWIRSDGKKGTAFFFTVPAARNENNVTPGDVS